MRAPEKTFGAKTHWHFNKHCQTTESLGERGQAFEPTVPSENAPRKGAPIVGCGGGLRPALLRIGERGQAFEPFRMLIAAVMALAVLLIIIGAIQYFDAKQFEISKQRFYDGISNAVRQPNGELLAVEGLQFQRGDAYSSNGVGEIVGLKGECIGFSGTGAVGIEPSPEGVVFMERVQADAFITCEPGGSPECEVSCEISFEEP